jgi:hypothetical protein
MNYPSSMNVDNNLRAARTFNAITFILSASFIMIEFLSGCLSTNATKSCTQSGGLGYLVCCLCSGLSLLILDSNVCKSNVLMEQIPGFEEATCSMSKGGKSVVAATVLYFVAAVGVMVLHPIRKKEAESDEGLDEPLLDDDDFVQAQSDII